MSVNFRCTGKEKREVKNLKH